MTAPYMAAGGLLRVYPATDPTGAGLVWAHGGAFVHGSLDMNESDWVALELAVRGTTVVSVDYRLTTETENRYPAASDDMLAAWGWTRAHAGDLGILPELTAIGGTSAGGNLAAGATLRLIESGSAAPALAVLAYPTLLAEQPEPSPELRAKLDADPAADRFQPDRVRSMYEVYLGGSVVDAPVAAVPGLAGDELLAQFPPTFMVNSDADQLRTSGEAFAERLRAAGREVNVVTEPGTTHGHLNRPDEGPGPRASIERIAARLRDLSIP
ncbi:MAG: alpha/beta hydrolase [Microbacterium gubbeenense]|uniref:alpha/beta hydrolase n=1 Tax=Microbacterium gubbeenense TaxID=159896 RepID=UPI003F957EE2